MLADITAGFTRTCTGVRTWININRYTYDVLYACKHILSTYACICMEQLCINSRMHTQKQFYSLAWPCELVELCDVNVLWHSLQACKIKQGLPQEDPYILKLWFPLLHIRQDVESCCLKHSLTHTDIYTMLYHWKCRVCIMYPCFFRTEHHVVVSSQDRRYHLDTHSVFTLFFSSFRLCLSMCILSWCICPQVILHSPSNLH